jgi:hypothetical protein
MAVKMKDLLDSNKAKLDLAERILDEKLVFEYLANKKEGVFAIFTLDLPFTLRDYEIPILIGRYKDSEWYIESSDGKKFTFSKYPPGVTD